MGIRKHKPTTPGRRGSSVADFVEVTRSTPEKSLLRPLSKSGGRNSQGRVTTRHHGGGHKRQYRVIDFRRHDKDGVPARVAHIEYDPNRTARIALLHYADGEKRYILAPNRLKQNDRIEAGPTADIKPGNSLALRNIPVGTVIHAVELRPGGGAVDGVIERGGCGRELFGRLGRRRALDRSRAVGRCRAVGRGVRGRPVVGGRAAVGRGRAVRGIRGPGARVSGRLRGVLVVHGVMSPLALKSSSGPRWAAPGRRAPAAPAWVRRAPSAARRPRESVRRRRVPRRPRRCRRRAGW